MARMVEVHFEVKGSPKLASFFYDVVICNDFLQNCYRT